jgi:hypothetical protein
MKFQQGAGWRGAELAGFGIAGYPMVLMSAMMVPPEGPRKQPPSDAN